MKAILAQALALSLVSLSCHSDMLDGKAYAPSGKLLGNRIVSTQLEGTWVGLATSIEVVNNEVKRTDAAHLICFIYKNGSTFCDGQHSGEDGMLHNEDPWSGQLYQLTPQVYTLVNGDPQAPDAGCALYEIQTNRAHDSATALLLSTGECSGVTKSFWELNNFVKISDCIDYRVPNAIIEVTDQWVVP